MTPWLWCDPLTGLPEPDPGGPLRVWEEPDMPATDDTLSLLFEGAMGGDGVAVDALGDALAERLSESGPRVDVWADGAKLYLDTRLYPPGVGKVWGHITGKLRPMRYGEFTRDGFAVEFAAWLREVLRIDG